MYVIDKYDRYSIILWNADCIWVQVIPVGLFLGLRAEVRPSLSNQHN
jgi:hypothetical protein